jgi:hypothetical protein
MTIYRGLGGGGNATTDSQLNALTAIAAEALASALVSANAATATAGSVSAAATSAATATTQAGNASTSASAAAVSAASVFTSAATASTQAGIATTQAGIATTQAAAAVTTVSSLAASGGAALVGYLPAGTGAVATTVQGKLRESVSVLDFLPSGTVLSPSLDVSVWVQAAIDAGDDIHFPSGDYYLNVHIGNKILTGVGNTKTRLFPFNIQIAAVTVVVSPPYWSGHKEIRNIGFGSPTAKTGVGVAFGTTDITLLNYAGGATSNNPLNAVGTYGFSFIQYAQSFKFYGCDFIGLEKGVSFTAGNIGAEFYSCGYHSCKYGIYALSNKGGGDAMQAGVKTFIGGEASSNDCAFYFHNTLAVNGNIKFDSVVMEYNKINIYSYDDYGPWITPLLISNCWNEGNGAHFGGTVAIDQWAGSATTLVKSTQTLTCAAWIFDGIYGNYVYDTSFVGDISLRGLNTKVDVNTCHIESSTGYSGGPFNVTTPASSSITCNDCYTNGGATGGAGVYINGLRSTNAISGNPTTSSSAWFTTSPRTNIAQFGARQAISQPFNIPVVTSGSFTLTGGIVADGLLYPICNEYSRASFTGGEYVSPAGTTITTTAGWYVSTVDIKVVVGSVMANLWDRSTNQGYIFASSNRTGAWDTFGFCSYSPGGQQLYLDFSGTGVSTTWRVSAYQIIRFDTQVEAVAYLTSSTYTANRTENQELLASSFKSGSGSVSAPTSVATTLFGLPGTGRFEVFAYITSGDAANYAAFATVLREAGGGQRIVANNAGLLTLTLSGGNIQVTQASGAAQTVVYRYLRIN